MFFCSHGIAANSRFTIASIKHAAGTIAGDLMASYRPSNNPPGLFPAPYYWWESGAVWGGMIDYWYLTGDDQYNSIVRGALLSQVGPNDDYMPPNQTKSEVCMLAADAKKRGTEQNVSFLFISNVYTGQ